MKDLLQFPSASNCSKTPVNLQSWAVTPAQICLTRRLDCLSFTFSAELRPPHPHIHLFRLLCVCTIPSDTWNPLFLDAFLLSSLYSSLFCFIWSQLSLFRSPWSAAPSLHPRSQSSLSLSTSHTRPNPSPIVSSPGSPVRPSPSIKPSLT